MLEIFSFKNDLTATKLNAAGRMSAGLQSRDVQLSDALARGWEGAQADVVVSAAHRDPCRRPIVFPAPRPSRGCRRTSSPVMIARPAPTHRFPTHSHPDAVVQTSAAHVRPPAGEDVARIPGTPVAGRSIHSPERLSSTRKKLSPSLPISRTGGGLLNDPPPCGSAWQPCQRHRGEPHNEKAPHGTDKSIGRSWAGCVNTGDHEPAPFAARQWTAVDGI